MEVDSVRRYRAGDEVRAIDWRVTARRGHLHVRRFVEERNLEVFLVVDRSASLHDLCSEAPGRAAVDVAALLAVAASRAAQRVSLLQVTDAIESYIRPGSGRRHGLHILHSLMALRSRGRGTDLPAALRAARRAMTARGLVVVVSDFEGIEPERFGDELGRIAHRHDVLPVVLRVPGMEDLPSVGVVRIVDPETGRSAVVDTSDAQVRTALAARARRARERLDDLFGSAGVRPLHLDPSRDVAPQLLRHFTLRSRRTA